MRFRIRSLERSQHLAKQLKQLLSMVGVDASLTDCQAGVAGCLGYASWAEMRLDAGSDPSPLDEDAGIEAWTARIDRQVTVIQERFNLPGPIAAGVAKALRPTGRQRSGDIVADLAAFLPFPRGLTATPAEPATSGEVEVSLLQWEETERGWGTRPDGFSVHATPEAAVSFADAHIKALPYPRPDEYSRPCSDVVRLSLPAEHPARKALAEGKTWLWGDDARAVATVWPRNAGGWQSIPVKSEGTRTAMGHSSLDTRVH